MKLTDKQREQMIDRLEEDMTETVAIWAAESDQKCLRVYVAGAERLDEYSDIELADHFRDWFGEDIPNDN